MFPSALTSRRRSLNLLLGATIVALLAALMPFSPLTGRAQAADLVIGPGRPSEPGFVGYVLADGGQLGIARLANGTYAVCIDTGGSHPWPSGTPPFVNKANSNVGYLVSTYLPVAQTNPYYAAALWWVIGLDMNLNSNKPGAQAHVNALKRKDPGAYTKVANARTTMLNAMQANAAPAAGYQASTPVVAYTTNGGTVSNIGFKNRTGKWAAGYGLTLTLTGDGVFANGTRTLTFKSKDTPATVAWKQTGNDSVKVTLSLTGAPGDQYRLHTPPAPQQRTVAVAARATHTATGTLAPGYVRVLKVDAATNKGLAGATFLMFRDRNENKKPDTGEYVTRNTTTEFGFTSVLPAFKNELVCVQETVAPTNYYRNSNVHCARAHGVVADPTRITVTNDKIWQPNISTKTTAPIVKARTSPSDAVTITNTGGHATTMTWTLYGPLAPNPSSPGTVEPTVCTGTLNWASAPQAATGTIPVTGDKTYTVSAPAVTKPGCYTWAITLAPQKLLRAATSAAGQPAETFLTIAAPTLTTQVNKQRATPGVTLVDTVKVSGTENQTVNGTWTLHGPKTPLLTKGVYTCVGVNWAGAPVLADGTFTVTQDGNIQVGSTQINKPGCYTYTEAMAATPTTAEFPETKAGIPSETSLVRSEPRLTTTVSDRTPVAGDVLTDTVHVTGTGGLTLTGHWKLLGPTHPNNQGTCVGINWKGVRVAGQGTFTIHGDGNYVVGKYATTQAGCYTYTESLTGTPFATPVNWTRPGIVSETAGVTPTLSRFKLTDIHSGGESAGTQNKETSAMQLARMASTSQTITIDKVGLAASLTYVNDNGHGYLLPPKNINVGGIYRPSQPLNAYAGTTLIAGHVSDNHDRAGQFKKLLKSKVGMIITTKSGGKTTRWKIANIISTPKGHLPSIVTNNTLARRLVLVTCTSRVTYSNGGFHYRNNLTVVAVPVY